MTLFQLAVLFAAVAIILSQIGINIRAQNAIRYGLFAVVVVSAGLFVMGAFGVFAPVSGYQLVQL